MDIFVIEAWNNNGECVWQETCETLAKAKKEARDCLAQKDMQDVATVVILNGNFREIARINK